MRARVSVRRAKQTPFLRPAPCALRTATTVRGSAANVTALKLQMITAALTALAIWACPAAADRLTVVASLFPLYDFTREVAGDTADVTLLLPPGTEPHTWSPKPSDMARIAGADLFVYLGPDMEPWVNQVLEATSGKGRVLEASRGLALLSPDGRAGSADGGQHDPHVWLDLANASEMVDLVAAALAEIDRPRAAEYRDRSTAYRARLSALDSRFRETLSRCRKRQFVFGGHAAFAYLARRYGLEQIPVYSLSPDSEPSPRQVAQIVKVLRALDLEVVYFEELVNPRLAQVIAGEVGARTLMLTPAGNLTAQQRRAGATFLSIMESNLHNLAEGLGCE